MFASLLLLGLALPSQAAPAGDAAWQKFVQEQAGRGREDALDLGDFKVVYGPARTAVEKRWRARLKKSHVLEDEAATLSAQLRLPGDVVIELTPGDDANAYYDPETRRIHIYYSFLEANARLLKPSVEPASQLVPATLLDLTFVFYHEVGHALIDLYAIPSTGREEDSVDQLATLILITGEGGVQAATMAAVRHMRGEMAAKGEAPRFWDQHSLDGQRFYDILCLVYGKDPERRKSMVGELLPAERARSCPREFERLDKAWDALLAPYVKP